MLQNELEVATAEVERAQQRLIAIEREKDTLRQQVSDLSILKCWLLRLLW